MAMVSFNIPAPPGKVLCPIHLKNDIEIGFLTGRAKLKNDVLWVSREGKRKIKICAKCGRAHDSKHYRKDHLCKESIHALLQHCFPAPFLDVVSVDRRLTVKEDAAPRPIEISFFKKLIEEKILVSDLQDSFCILRPLSLLVEFWPGLGGQKIQSIRTAFARSFSLLPRPSVGTNQEFIFSYCGVHKRRLLLPHSESDKFVRCNEEGVVYRDELGRILAFRPQTTPHLFWESEEGEIQPYVDFLRFGSEDFEFQDWEPNPHQFWLDLHSKRVIREERMAVHSVAHE